jgi:cell division protein FtsL
MQEMKVSTKTEFVTLTYQTRYLSFSPSGRRTLVKKDLQQFFKRLRINQERAGNNSKITYYAAGEYGGKLKRPHYHLIIFNAEKQHIAKAWQINGEPIGRVHFGKQISSQAIAYTCKYINKTPSRNWHHSDDRQKEFSLMSKGIGQNYLTPQMVRWHKQNDVTYCVEEGGVRVSIPRYYKEKIWNPEEREIISANQVNRIKDKTEKQIEDIRQQVIKTIELQIERAKTTQQKNYLKTLDIEHETVKEWHRQWDEKRRLSIQRAEKVAKQRQQTELI